MQKHRCDKMEIKDLDILVRVYNSLRRTNLSSVGDMLRILYGGREAISRIRNFYEYSLHNLLDKLEEKCCLPSDLPLDVDIRSQKKRIVWIASSQADDGSWYQNIEITIAALLSLIRSIDADKPLISKADIAKGMSWLQDNCSHITGGTLHYAIQRVIAEYHNSRLPDCPFNVEEYKTKQRVFNIVDLRRVALIRGNAKKGDPCCRDAHPSGRGLGPVYNLIEIAWMTVRESVSE